MPRKEPLKPSSVLYFASYSPQPNPTHPNPKRSISKESVSWLWDERVDLKSTCEGERRHSRRHILCRCICSSIFEVTAQGSGGANVSDLKELNCIMLLIKRACDSNVPENLKTRFLSNWLSSIRKLLLLSQAQKCRASICRKICNIVRLFHAPGPERFQRKRWSRANTCNQHHHSNCWAKTSPTLTALRASSVLTPGLQSLRAPSSASF